MNKIDRAILNSLKINLGYKPGEKVAIVMQEWNPNFENRFKHKFEKATELCLRMYKVFSEAGADTELLSYQPQEARSGVDATQDLYEKIGFKDIIFMPTVFSLTHTDFRKTQTEKGSRLASMPGFTLEMFEEGGPMDVDYKTLNQQTEEIADKLRASRSVRVLAEDTDITVEIDPTLVHVSSGLLDKPGKYGNLPGAEAYVVPVHEGNTSGYFTVPAGWGGPAPLKFRLKFFLEKGRFVEVKGDTEEAQQYAENEIKPLIFGGQDFEVLAELGIGTNPNITSEYVQQKGWNTLVAEKIFGSAHLANGNSKAMGGLNDVPVHIDWVIPGVKLDFQP
ncbi:MAG: aminopeptidase [Candidatus Saccharicenans sp.]|uniref:aminopeptidase n=1 Tax=Candidatus Saccharicenans sp. TaxID=2819258 RepID=UPI0040499D1C